MTYRAIITVTSESNTWNSWCGRSYCSVPAHVPINHRTTFNAVVFTSFRGEKNNTSNNNNNNRKYFFSSDVLEENTIQNLFQKQYGT